MTFLIEIGKNGRLTKKSDREDSRLELRYKKEFKIENDHFYEIHRFRITKN